MAARGVVVGNIIVSDGMLSSNGERHDGGSATAIGKSADATPARLARSERTALAGGGGIEALGGWA